jgi:two-component system, cell cycle sensor histidine kinase and response regulator CckA
MGILSHFFSPSRDFDNDPVRTPLSVKTDDEVVDIDDLVDKRTADAASISVNQEEQRRPLEEPERVFFRTLMDELGDLVYFKDLKSRFTMANSALAHKINPLTDNSYVVGKTDFDIFAHEHARKAYEDEQKIIATGKPLIGIEEKEVWPDGHETWVITSKFPLKDTSGKTVGTWGISKDITDRKRTEQELKSTEEQLRHSQKMEAFGQLAGGIAHDFNNIISVILGAAQLLEMDLKDHDKEAKNRIDMVIDASKRAAELTQQLLSFARKGKYTIVAMDVHEVIQSVIRLIIHTFDKRIRVVERLTARSTIIMADFAQMQNALLNLALNARDAMPDGGTLSFETATVGPEVNIGDTQHGEVTPGSFLRLRISDTGCGMDKKTKDRAFEPFFTTKGPGKGTGLGLASVYGTIKNINGMIEIDSTPGKGTQFTIFLPLVIKQVDAQKEGLSCAGKKKATILIVEDDADLRLVLREMLEEIGYGVYSCRDGMEAVEYYKVNHGLIDVTIVDLAMPRMGGQECIKLFKQIDPLARILVSSGYNLVSDTQQIITKGIAGFVQKPYQTPELMRAIAEALNMC